LPLAIATHSHCLIAATHPLSMPHATHSLCLVSARHPSPFPLAPSASDPPLLLSLPPHSSRSQTYSHPLSLSSALARALSLSHTCAISSQSTPHLCLAECTGRQNARSGSCTGVVCCSVMQCVAVCCSVLRWSSKCNIVDRVQLWCVAVCWQCVAVCCSVSQRLPKEVDNALVQERERERERGWVWIVLAFGVC